MKYTLEKRIFEGNRIQTYYSTNLEVGDEPLSNVKKILYDGIKAKLGIMRDSSATMAVLTDGNTYTIMFLEMISLPYIEKLPKTVIRRNKTKAKEFNEPSFDQFVKAENVDNIPDFGLDLSHYDSV